MTTSERQAARVTHVRCDERPDGEHVVICVETIGDETTTVFTTISPGRWNSRRSFLRGCGLGLTDSPMDAVGRIVAVDLMPRPIVTGPRAGEVVLRVMRWHRPSGKKKAVGEPGNSPTAESSCGWTQKDS